MSVSTHMAEVAAVSVARGALRWQRPALVGLLLLAFLLRVVTLETQSLWSDEGITIIRSSLPLREILDQMPVEHTPGYFVVMHGWLAVAGVSDYALRYFSLCSSVLAVALIARLAADLALPLASTLAVVAAFLGAINPFQIAYAQEGRMYAPLLATACASMWMLWRMLHARPNRRWLWALGYALTTAATVYLHFYGALVPVAQALYVLVWTAATRRWSAALAWLAGAAGAFLLFLPWLPRSLAIFGFEGWRTGGDASQIPLQFSRAWLAGVAPDGWWQVILVLSLGLALIGAAWWTVRRAEAGALLLLWLAIPFAATIWMASRNPDYHERYLIYLGAPLTLLVAAGVAGLVPAAWQQGAPLSNSAWLALPIAALIVLAAGSYAAQYRLATDLEVQKPDFRGAAQRMLDEGKPGDVIFVDGPNPELVFNHYYTGELPVFDVGQVNTAPAQQRDAALRADSAGASRAWELLYYHMPAQVQVWLATQAYASAPTYHNNLRVTLYGLDTTDALTTTLDLPVGDALTLVSATLPAQAQAGDLLRVRTNWFTRAAAPDYRFSLRLYDAAGTLVANDDYVPQNWFAPTNVWVVDAAAQDQRALQLPPNLPEGEYTVALRLYDPATGAPQTTTFGDEISLGNVEVTP